jgi:hypothetical protein
VRFVDEEENQELWEVEVSGVSFHQVYYKQDWNVEGQQVEPLFAQWFIA